jgi:asparagine synthase (glutamine-hydrolysing)
MCGIASILFDSSAEASAGVRRMLASLHHRGPDAASAKVAGQAVLGHTRLSIIDLAQGAQPMVEERGRHWIVFNGEIFNFRELRTDLVGKGVHFQTNSDTEVLLKAYLTWGKAVLQRLRGQYAFVIWDQETETFFGARDPLGEKPFYYSRPKTGEGLLIASEIKALRSSGLVDMEINVDTLQLCLAFGYVPPDRTSYKHIQALPPAHFIAGNSSGWKVERYWVPQLSSTSCGKLKFDELVEKTRHLLVQAVDRQLVADVPVGALLSGGLDSTSVVAMMSDGVSQVETFAAGFGKDINELPFAAQASTAYHTLHHELHVDDLSIGEELNRIVEIFDEPYPDSSAIPTRLIAKFARERVKVVLTGDGGDEVFGGYDWYRWFLLRNRTDLGVFGTSLAQVILKKLARLGWKAADRFQRLGSGVRDYRHLQQQFNDPLQEHVMGATMAYTLNDPAYRFEGSDISWSEMLSTLGRNNDDDGIDHVSRFDLTHYLPGDVLTKVDRATMAHSLESRAPLLDLDLIEHALSIPHQIRMAWPDAKPLLRAAMDQRWPETIRKRAKQGFGAPIKAWIQRPDVKHLIDRVDAPGSPLRALMPHLPTRIFSSGTRPRLVWTLLLIGLWAERRT